MGSRVGPRSRIAFVTAVAVAASAAGVAAAAAGGLLFEVCVEDDDSGVEGCAHDSPGLDTAANIAVARKGGRVYVTGEGDDALVRLTRNGSDLIPAGCIDDEDSGADSCGATSPGMGDLYAVAVSRDSKSVYTTGGDDDALATFEEHGALIPTGCVDDDDTGTDGCGEHVDALETPVDVDVSPDDRWVYAVSEGDSALTRFHRSRTSLALDPRGCIDDNDSGDDQCAGSVNGLTGAREVVVSPDSKDVYVASLADSAIVHLRRRSGGRLRPRGCIDDKASGDDQCSRSTRGLFGPWDMAFSRNGRSLYVVTAYDHSIVRFARNPHTGRLRPRDCIEDSAVANGECGRAVPEFRAQRGVAVSPDGSKVYTTSGIDDSLHVLRRNGHTGRLRWRRCVGDDDTGSPACHDNAPTLGEPNGVGLSPSGKWVYVASLDEDAVAGFKRN